MEHGCLNSNAYRKHIHLFNKDYFKSFDLGKKINEFIAYN